MTQTNTLPAAMRGRFSRSTEAIRSRPVLTRWLLAGPGAVIVAGLTMAAMPVWLPAGEAGINNIAFPVILAPLLWAVPFFYATLAEDLPRCTLILVLAALLQAALVTFSLAG